MDRVFPSIMVDSSHIVMLSVESILLRLPSRPVSIGSLIQMSQGSPLEGRPLCLGFDEPLSGDPVMLLVLPRILKRLFRDPGQLEQRSKLVNVLLRNVDMERLNWNARCVR